MPTEQNEAAREAGHALSVWIVALLAAFMAGGIWQRCIERVAYVMVARPNWPPEPIFDFPPLGDLLGYLSWVMISAFGIIRSADSGGPSSFAWKFGAVSSYTILMLMEFFAGLKHYSQFFEAERIDGMSGVGLGLWQLLEAVVLVPVVIGLSWGIGLRIGRRREWQKI